MEKKTNNREIDNKMTKQVIVDKGLHKLLKLESAESGRSIRKLVEAAIVEAIGEISSQK